MLELLWIIPALPFAGFLILALIGSRLSRPVAAIIGAGSIGLSALFSIIISFTFFSPPENSFHQVIYSWFNIAGFNPSIAFYLDAMTVVFIFVITFVGFLIHLYSAEFMYEEEGYSRFFAYMNLFVGSMLLLVMADNLLLLYLGWEGVGLCSYLLIGFWYKDPANNSAARKAFIVTRIGDTAMAIGLFLLVMNFNSLNIQEILSSAANRWSEGSETAFWAAILLLGGALGKSAQLPLHTWLPDAMAGPSPVSALIHAATMVTAGVYLIARTNVIFTLAPDVLFLVAVIGAVTLIVAGFSALAQYDIKRVLAYSTISQIGYMFLALGAGAWSAAIFHFMIHAFFKALLFLSAGAVIIALHHEHDMFKMGGIRKDIPVIYWTFLIGSASLAALPLITAGFYSKDLILWYSFASESGSPSLWAAGLIGAFITALYSFRMVFVTFFGEKKTEIEHHPGNLIKIPLIILAVLSFAGGFIELPHTIADFTLFSEFMNSALPAIVIADSSAELLLQILTALITLAGVYLAYLKYLKKAAIKPEQKGFQKFFYSGWGFDKLYDFLFVKPFIWLSEINKKDFVDFIYTSIAWLSGLAHYSVAVSQTGKFRWYAMGIAFGAILLITIAVFL